MIDLETTGLDVKRDRVVQAAALLMQGSSLLEAPRMNVLVNPGVSVPARAKAIHGLGDEELEGAPAFSGIADDLLGLLQGRVVVGHHVGFDLGVLREETARAGRAWRDPPFLDIAVIAGALERSLPDQGLETIARWLGVGIRGRHTAMGDALAAAEVFARLIARMRDAGVRTLGEAQALTERRPDLTRRQLDAGWLLAPALPERDDNGRLERVDRFIYERRLGEVMSAPPVSIPRDTSLRQAAQIMAARRIGALLVGSPGEPAEGIITERDLLRASADAGVDADRVQVVAVMSSPVQCLRADEMLYRALGRMDRAGMRHLCVVDEAGTPVGMVSQRDLLHFRARRALVIGDAIAAATDAVALAGAYGQLPEVAAALMAEGVAAAEIAQVISAELRALSARAADLTAASLAASGQPAPTPWCLVVLGSGGRGESLLGADQDNALIYRGAPADDAWFARLGEGIASLLDEAGVPRCKGGVMASNPQWRGTEEAWRERIVGWLTRAAPRDLLNVDIFFDLAPVAGHLGIGRALQQEALATASASPAFIGSLAETVADRRPALGPFGSLRAREGRVDLKMGGLLPLVGLARTLALRAASTERSTPGRLRAAAKAGRLADADAETLVQIHGSLMSLVLRQQLADLGVGVPPSGRVAVARLGREESRRLSRDLRRLDEILQEVRSAVSG